MSSKKLNPFKDIQSDQIQRSSRKIFTAHQACRNAALNLTPVTGTTHGFIFQITNSLIESQGVRLTWFDCNFVISAKETLQNAPRWICRLNFAMCSSDFPCFQINFQEITSLSIVLSLLIHNVCSKHDCETTASLLRRRWRILQNFNFRLHFLGSLSNLFSNCHVNDVRNSGGFESSFYPQKPIFGLKKYISSISIQLHRTFLSFHFEIALMF